MSDEVPCKKCPKIGGKPSGKNRDGSPCRWCNGTGIYQPKPAVAS